MTTAGERRIRILHVTPEFLEEAILRVAIEDPPADLMMIGAAYDSLRARFVLIMQSPDFAPVPEGTVPPFWDVICYSPLVTDEAIAELKAGIDLLHLLQDSAPTHAESVGLADETLGHLGKALTLFANAKPCGDDAGLPRGAGL